MFPLQNPSNETTPLLNGSSSTGAPTSADEQSSAPNAVPLSEGQQSSEDDLSMPIDWLQLLRFISPYLVPDSLRLKICALLSFACEVAEKICNLLPPFALKWIVDTLAANTKRPAEKAVVPLLALLLFYAARIFTRLFGGLGAISYEIVAMAITKRFRVDMFKHLQNLDITYHTHRKTGELCRVMDRGTDSMETLFSIFLFILLPTFLETVLVTGVFLKLGTPLIALVTFASILLYFWFTKVGTEISIPLRRKTIEFEDTLSEKAVDTLINFETVKTFAMENFEVRSYDRLNTTFCDLCVKHVAAAEIVHFGQLLIKHSGWSISLFLAALGATHGHLSPGDFVLINMYIGQLFGPLAHLGHSYRTLVKAATDIERCIDLFETKPRVNDREDAVHLELSEKSLIAKQKGQIRFDNVSFRYCGVERVGGGVQDISFCVEPGKMLGIVGPSGSGKSTLMRLALRFYDPDEGAVLIDGKDIRGYTQQSLRDIFGVVSQDTSLFNEDLRYNISYGKESASDAEIHFAVKAAALSDFVSHLPLKLETVVGERGIRLSGGEKQRVNVARCILRSPIFVLLDEASSALDSKTEKEMQENLRDVCKGRTSIVVAHRLSTIIMADEIIFLNEGGIVERGTHEELLAKQGKYAAMWATQTDTTKETEGDNSIFPDGKLSCKFEKRGL